jgi:hypothetical protein
MTLRYKLEYFGKNAQGTYQVPTVSKALEYVKDFPENYAYVICDLKTHTIESYRYTQVMDFEEFQNLIERLPKRNR